jgi:Chaperone of endosialidase
MRSMTSRPPVSGVVQAILVLALAAGQSAAGEEGRVSAESWNAPPYWTPPALAPRGHDTLAAGRQSLAAGPTALPFIALPPCRLVDTRGNAPLTGGFLPPATVRSYTLSGVCGVPANAQAISLNATVVHPTGPGFLTIYPEGGTFPPVSTLNYLGNDVVVNAAVVPLSGAGGISIALGVSGGDVILDTNGYYATVPSVTSLNALAGDLTLQGGGSVTVIPNAGTITIAVPPGVTSITGTNGISASPTSPSGAVTVTSNATFSNTGNTIVLRSASGDFDAGSINVNGSLRLPATDGLGAGTVTLNGSRFLHGYGLSGNVFLGANSGNLSLTVGSANGNVGAGRFSLSSLTSGQGNTAVGNQSLMNATTGSNNVAVGNSALQNIASGNDNVAIGVLAGFSLTAGSNNVHIGNPGLSSESNAIRIGSGSGGISIPHTAIYLAAVRGVTTGLGNTVPVLIDGAGQLGTTNSSIRFKDDVRDMGEESAKLMQLRPVTFRYKAHGPDGPKQFGLVAEEVDAVLPELVARSKDGEIETVMYHQLPALLLNEIQRLEKRVADLERRLSETESPRGR